MDGRTTGEHDTFRRRLLAKEA